MDSPGDTFLKSVLKAKSFNPICEFTPNILGIELDTIRKFEKSAFLFTLQSFSMFMISYFISQTKTPYWISKEFFAYAQCHLIRKR